MFSVKFSCCQVQFFRVDKDFEIAITFCGKQAQKLLW
jgi:hypothetical protein